VLMYPKVLTHAGAWADGLVRKTVNNYHLHKANG